MAITKPATAIVPAAREGDVDLSLPLPDGRSVRLRSVRSTDGTRALRLPVSTGSRRVPLLFLTIDPGLDQRTVDRMLQVDDERAAVIATVGHDLVAVGHLHRIAGTDRAGITLAVAPAFAGVGIERALSGALATRAHHEGVTTVEPAGEAP